MKNRELIQLLIDRFDGDAEVVVSGKSVTAAEYDKTFRTIELELSDEPHLATQRVHADS